MQLELLVAWVVLLDLLDCDLGFGYSFVPMTVGVAGSVALLVECSDYLTVTTAV